MKASRLLVAAAASIVCAAASAAPAVVPTYNVIDLGRPDGNNVGHADGISASGNYIVGRGVVGSNNAFVWSTAAGTRTTLSAYTDGTTTYANNWAVGVNDGGTIVGMASTSAGTTADGTAYSAGVPVVWKNGTATALAASGRVFGINNAGIAVGSTGTIGAVNQRAAIFDTNTLTTSYITTQTDYGASMKSAAAINNSGLIVGTGTFSIDTGAMAVGLLYNPSTSTMTTIASSSVGGSVTTADINNNGQVVGTITNAGVSTPYSWNATSGMSAVPLPVGYSGGVATGINDSGVIVGYAHNSLDANLYAFVDIAGNSYLLSSLLADATGWNFTSSSQLTITGIGNDGTISGYTYYLENGTSNRIHAFSLQVAAAVPEPGTYALMLAGIAAVGAVVRRRRPS